MAFVPPFNACTEEIRTFLKPLRNRFSMALYNCQNPFAIGAMIRIAHNFLAKEIFLIESSSYYHKASMGMEKYENIIRFSQLQEFRNLVQPRAIWAFEKDNAHRSLYQVDTYPSDVVLLFGSERFGLSLEALELCDDILAIPIYGINHSLPVAVAAGIVMHDWAQKNYHRDIIF